ncbi:MAG TPA: alpha-amylase family glycosyl hydrolase [Bacteroidales bacterium]|nr:alpha-amylase family glycosyl hydrolase [Bacteroidales bacterium]
MKQKYLRITLFIFLMSTISGLHAQADIMMQGWYWDYPKTPDNANWADTLRLKATELGQAGFTFIWLPPLSRAASSNWSNGYDPKDLFDYGEFGQGATGFGTRQDVDDLISALSAQNIKAVADLVYNHRDGGSIEDNPGLKNYIVNFFDADKINTYQANPFPYDRMRVVLPLGGSSGHGAGDYYFKFRSKSQHSKFYNWEYQLYMWTDKVGWQNQSAIVESEPNGGSNCSQTFNTIYLGRHILGNIDTDVCGIDEFKLTLTENDFNASGDAVYIEFNGRNSGYSDLYIHGIWSAAQQADIVDELYYQTYTNFTWVPSGRGKMDWSYFKPNSNNTTYLAGDWDWMYFYYDYDQFQQKTRDSLFSWTRWNWSDAGIRGIRVDAVKHFSTEFIGDLLDNLYDYNMIPQMVVGEWYDANPQTLANWVNNVYLYMDNDTKQAIAPRIFDFSLRDALRNACDTYDYDVRNIFNASIVDNTSLSGINVVTFVNNHDFRGENPFSSLIQQDVILAYAYILTNNQIGAPTVFYPDYFGYPAQGQPGYQTYHPADKAPHKDQINQLITIHNDYIFGASGRNYLNNFTGGKPNSLGDNNKYAIVYQLQGESGFKDLVIALNYMGQEIGFSQELDGIAMGTYMEDLTGNALHKSPVVENANGINNSIWINIPSRSYAIYRIGSWGLWNATRSYGGFNVNGTPVTKTFWDETAGDIQNYDFGTFTGTNSLELTSFDIKTWKKSGADVTGGSLFYSIYPKGERPASPVFTEINLNWLENIGGEITGDQKWGFENLTVNLLENLSSGEYTIEFYIQMNGNDPNKSEYDSNNGSNYTAHFRYNYVRSAAGGKWNNPLTWLDGKVPSSDAVSVEILHDVLVDDSRIVNDLFLYEGSLTVSPTFSLTAEGIVTSTLNESGLILLSTASGTASFIHHSEEVPATVQRYITGANWQDKNSGWHLIAAPVSGQQISGTWTPSGTGNDYDFYTWDESENLWLNQKEPTNEITEFLQGNGYLVAYQNTDLKEFKGKINVNNLTFEDLSFSPSAGKGWHLMGNPFASALKWNTASWNLYNISGVAKIWHRENRSYIDLQPETIIPAGQGFMVQAGYSDNSITIPEQERLHDATPFFKENEAITILLAAREASGKQVQESYITINPLATEGFDFNFDSRFLAGYAPWFYSVADGEKLSTNSIPAITKQISIPFAFIKNQADDFIIELKEAPPEADLILTDLKLNSDHRLTIGLPYTFSSESSDIPERFILRIGSLGISNHLNQNQTKVWYFAEQLFVQTNGYHCLLNVYDGQGRLTKTELLTEKGLNHIPFRAKPGIYFVTLTGNSDTSPVKLIIP